MKKILKIMIYGLMATSFQMQFASHYPDSSSSASGAGAGAGAGYRPVENENTHNDTSASCQELQAVYEDITVDDCTQMHAAYVKESLPNESFVQYFERMQNDPRYVEYRNDQKEDEHHGLTFQQYLDNETKKLYQACLTFSRDRYDNALMSARKSIARGANVNQAELNSRIMRCNTPLLAAAHQGNLPMVELLLQNGAAESINTADYEGNTPLFLAININNKEMVDLLLKNGAVASINQINNASQSTPFAWAISSNNVEIIQLLLDAKDAHGQQALNLLDPINIDALHAIINDGNESVVKAIIESESFNWQHPISVYDVLESLTNPENIKTLKGAKRRSMIALFEKYLLDHGNPGGLK